MRVRVVASTVFADESEGTHSRIEAKEGDLHQARNAIKVLKAGEDAEGGHDDHEEPAEAVAHLGTEIPAADGHHRHDERDDSEPEDEAAHSRSEDHRLSEERDHACEDKEDEQEILHDAATLAPAFGSSSDGEEPSEWKKMSSK